MNLGTVKTSDLRTSKRNNAGQNTSTPAFTGHGFILKAIGAPALAASMALGSMVGCGGGKSPAPDATTVTPIPTPTPTPTPTPAKDTASTKVAQMFKDMGISNYTETDPPKTITFTDEYTKEFSEITLDSTNTTKDSVVYNTKVTDIYTGVSRNAGTNTFTKNGKAPGFAGVAVDV